MQPRLQDPPSSDTHRQRRDRETGASAVEYALILGGVAATIIAILFVFGGPVLGLFESSCTSLNSKLENDEVTCDDEAGGE